MKKQHKILIALLTVSVGIAGMAGVAAARGGCYGPRMGHGYGPGPALTPEAVEIMQKHHATMGPLFMELEAKKQELDAKIYGGADEATVKALVAQVNSLQDRLTEAGAEMNKQLAKTGVTFNAGMVDCPALCAGFQGGKYGRGYHGGGYGYHRGGYGYHGGGHGHGYMRGGPGYGFHGPGGCPYVTSMPAPGPQ